MFEGVATAHTCAHPTSSTSLGRHCDTITILNHPHMAVFILIVLLTYLRQSNASGTEKRRILSHCLCHFHQDRNPRWVGRHRPALASMGQQTPDGTQGGKSGGNNLEIRLPCSSKNVQDCKNRHFGTQRHDRAPVEPTSLGCAVSDLSKKCRDEVSGERSAVSQDTTKAVVWRTTTTLFRAPVAQRVEVLLTKQLQVQRLTKA